MASFSGAMGSFLGVLVVCAFVRRGRWLVVVMACVVAGTTQSAGVEFFLSPMWFLIWPTELAALAGAVSGGLLATLVGRRLLPNLAATS